MDTGGESRCHSCVVLPAFPQGYVSSFLQSDADKVTLAEAETIQLFGSLSSSLIFWSFIFIRGSSEGDPHF